MANIDQLIKTVFTAAFAKFIYSELRIGKLASSDKIKRTGDYLQVLMPSEVEIFRMNGDYINRDVQVMDNSSVQIPIKDKIATYFTVSEEKRDQIERAEGDQAKINLIKEASDDAVKKAAAIVDKAFGELYPEAGLRIQASSITLTKDNLTAFFSTMRAVFARGTKNIHTSWVNGQMLAICPPELTALMTNMDNLLYVESRAKTLKDGYIGQFLGWDILESNQIAQPTENQFFPLFGREGRTLAGGVQKELKLISNIPDKGFNTEFKGNSVYGVGAPRADWFGTQAVNIDLGSLLAA